MSHTLKIAVTGILYSICFSESATAQSAEQLRVRQISNERGRIAAEILAGIVVSGDEYVATVEGGKQCALKVVDVRGSIATLNSSTCRSREDIRPGMILERSLLPSEPVPEKTVEVKAGDRTPLMTRLSDLSFLPQKGRTIFEIDIHRISTSETLNRANGTVVASDRAAVSSILRLYHGITNQLTIGTYLQQALNDQTSNSYGPASTQNGVRTTTQTQGPFDPSFLLEYRALTQGPDPINSFVGFTLKPSIVDAKSPTTTSNGTNGSGGHTATLSGRIVYEAEHIGTELQSAFTFKDKRTTKDETAGTSTDITGGDVFQIAATAQAKLSNLLTMNLGLVWYAIGATESRTGSNPNTIVSAFTYTAYTISARTTLVPDQLMLFLTLQGVGSVNSKLKSNSIEYDDSISSNSVTVGGAFMF